MEELIRVTQLPVIEEQLRTLKASIEERTAQAESLACTDETLAAVKSARADMSREFASYEAQRKAVKAAIMAPYEQFERVYTECVAEPFRRADAALKGKINDTEDGLKAACEAGLRAYFDELCSARGLDWLTFERSGVKVDMASARAKTPKKLREQLAAFVGSVAWDAESIEAPEVLVEYKQSLDLPAAMMTVRERRRRVEAERADGEARAADRQMERERVARVEALAPPVVTQDPPQEAESAERFYICAFKVRATRETLKKLKEFMESEGIQYE